MKQTKDPDLAQAFELARRYIETGAEEFICSALDTAYVVNLDISSQTHIKARQLVIARMNGVLTLDHWLTKNYPNLRSTINSGRGAAKLRRTRLAWLDSLIKEFT